jgi:hypothetical protein
LLTQKTAEGTLGPKRLNNALDLKDSARLTGNDATSQATGDGAVCRMVKNRERRGEKSKTEENRLPGGSSLSKSKLLARELREGAAS